MLKVYNHTGIVSVVDNATIGTDAVSVGYFESTSITQVDGMVGIGTDIPTAMLNVAGNAVISGTLSVTGNVSATSIAGTLSTQAQPAITSIGTLSSLNVTGNVATGNVSATSIAGTLSTAAQPNLTTVGNLSFLNVTGNVAAGNVTATAYTGTRLSLTGNISAGNVSGTTLAGTLSTEAQPSITSVGNLSSLNVTGNVVAGNVSATLRVRSGNDTVFTESDTTTFTFSNKLRLFYNEVDDTLEVQRFRNNAWVTTTVLVSSP